MPGRMRRRLRALLFKRAVDHELDAELRYHLEREVEQNLQEGMSPEEARSAALKAFGGVEQAKEECRQARGVRLIEDLWQDLWYGVRMLWKKPSFTLVAVLTLALGIGATTAIFTVAYAVLLRPLPYQNADRTVYVWARNKSEGITEGYLTYSDVIDYRARSQSFKYLAAYTTVVTNLTDAGEPERIEGFSVTSDFFRVLGASPLIGRTFTADDDREDSDIVILSYGLWQRKFGGDPGVIGKTIKLDMFWGNSFEVIGVMPRDFQFPERSELWTHASFNDPPTHDDTHIFRALGLLKSGVTLAQAQAESDGIAQRLAEEYPKSNGGWGLNLVSLPEYIFGKTRIALFVLIGAVGFLLLIACMNIANLQLVRALSRRREMAVRTALGAGRWRIVRQLLTESLLLSLIGGAVGLISAFWCIHLLHVFGPQSMPRLADVGINMGSLLFTAGISLLVGVLFGIAPAFYVSRADLNELLKEGGRSAATSPAGKRARHLLVVAQMALALTLLVGAGLLIKSFLRLRDVSPGFDPEGLLTLSISLTRADYPQGDARRTAFFKEALAHVAAIPGVTSVGAISHLPLGGRGVNTQFTLEGNADPTASADLRVISPDYFSAIKIPLLGGRWFTDRDTQQTPNAIVVNETFARIFFPGNSPVGRRMTIKGLGPPQPLFTGEIIGVVGDVRHRGLEEDARPEMYVSYLQNTVWPVMNLVIRTTGDPAGFVPAVRREIQAIDKGQPIFNVKTMAQLLSESMAQRRFNMLLLASFAAIALSLAAVGIYGVISYTVSLRTHEIGVRMALGAQAADVLKLVVGQGMLLVFIGTTIGLISALALTPVMTSLLYGVGPTDPMTFAIVILVLAFTALFSCYIPARRATKVDPLVALRYE
jgi:predicted permease